MNFIVYLIIVNIIAFLVCFLDKKLAIKKRRRVPESYLLVISLIGGCYGFLIAMYLFRHKTRKFKFKLIFLFSFIWLYILFNYYL